MQQMKRYSKTILTIAAALVLSVVAAVEVKAQESSVSAYSPYTMFGVGELGTHGNAVNRMMGGSGVAFRSTQMVSMLNPAGYSATPRNCFMLDVGVEGNFLKNSQRKYSGDQYTTAHNAKNSINFREIAIQFPVAKGLGFGLSLTPYGSVGYKMNTFEQSEDIWGSVGGVLYSYYGDGDVTEVKAGMGWEIFRGFSIGIAAKYYWGNILQNYTATVYGDYVGAGEFASTVGLDDYAFSNFKFQVGLQYNIISTAKRMLTVGATYDYGGPLRPKVTKSVYIGDYSSTVATVEDSRGQMRLPHSVNAGISYQDSRFITNFDYEYCNWGGDNAFYLQSAVNGLSVTYVDTHTYKFGFEYTPNRFDVRNYLKRMSFRIGARYGDYYQQFGDQRISQYAVTAGFGFPLRFMGATSINAGIEFGGRGKLNSVLAGGANPVGAIRQQYIKVNLGLSLFGEDYWFVRPKFD